MKCMIFRTPYTKIVKADVLLNGKPVDRVDSTIFFGITIDSKLQWGSHIDGLDRNRLRSAAFRSQKNRPLTDVETARLVYFSYFHSIMSYGILL